jgi:hypothetical protein
MDQLTREQRETLALARSLIRDMAHGWPARELAEDPEAVAARLTAMLGDEYDFAGGDVR